MLRYVKIGGDIAVEHLEPSGLVSKVVYLTGESEDRLALGVEGGEEDERGGLPVAPSEEAIEVVAKLAACREIARDPEMEGDPAEEWEAQSEEYQTAWRRLARVWLIAAYAIDTARGPVEGEGE